MLFNQRRMVMERTIPTKEQVLEAAKKCPQTKEALMILFPEDFREEYPEGYQEFGAFQYNGSFYFREELKRYVTCAYGAQPGPKGYHRAMGATLAISGEDIPKWVKTRYFN
jgi:hypothetical protein